MLKRVLKWTVGLIALFVIYLICLYAVQDKLIFFPDKNYVGPQSAGAANFTEVPLVTADSRMIMSWYVKGDIDKPAILFFHGNAGQIATFAPKLEIYRAAGYSILMPEYRGFASTTGELTEDTMYADAIIAFDYLQRQLKHKQIVVFGYSMGTAQASFVADIRHADALILAAPFSSLYRLVGEKHIPFAQRVLKKRLESEKYIAEYKNPLLVVHGGSDSLIPPHHSQIMFNRAVSKDKEFVLVPGVNHNQLFYDEENHQVIFNWLQRHFDKKK